MAQERIDPTPEEQDKQSENGSRNGAQFESDAKKLVRRHLEDKDHVITEEEIARIRVGMTPPSSEEITVTTDEEVIDEKVDKILGDKEDEEKDENEPDQKITPWDTLKD
jgi:hypothetical protein